MDEYNDDFKALAAQEREELLAEGVAPDDPRWITPLTDEQLKPVTTTAFINASTTYDGVEYSGRLYPDGVVPTRPAPAPIDYAHAFKVWWHQAVNPAVPPSRTTAETHVLFAQHMVLVELERAGRAAALQQRGGEVV